MLDFDAVLWDLDGTIVDTEPLWLAAETELASDHGREWTAADGLELVGSDLMDAGVHLQQKLQLAMTPGEIVSYLVERVSAELAKSVDWRPGAHELIEDLAAAGVPQALVTMSYAEIAEPIAQRLPFDAVITGDVVPRGKPHPDPYLLAAQRLGVDPVRCLAIEDSPTGATSANAAGCWVLAVPHMVQVPPSERRFAVKSLAGLSAADLRALDR